MLLALLACQPDESSPFGSGARVVDPGDDTGSVTTSLGTVSAPVVEETAKGTVFRVSWTTDVPTTSAVEYGTDDTFDHLIPAEDSEDGLKHAALLIGLAAGYEWTLRTVNETDEGTLVSTTTSVHTEPVSGNLPTFTVDNLDGVAVDGFVVCSAAAQNSAVFILDRAGRPVWWQSAATGALITGASMSLDGEFVEWFENGPSPALVRESLDGDRSERFDIPGGHHAFTALPQGGWAVAVADTRTVDGLQIQGDKIVELDREGQEVRTVWSTWDVIETGWSTSSEISPGLLDWTHLNSISYDAESNTYWASLYTLNTVVQLDAETGETVRIVGGYDGTETLTSGTPFQHQHSPVPVDGGLLIFDNGQTEDMNSRVVEYSLDTANSEYHETWSYQPDPTIFASILGNAERLDDGGTFIAWGAAGRLTELDAQGKVKWQANASLGGALGFSYLIPNLGGATR